MAGPSDAQALLLTVSADTSKAIKQLDALNKKLSGFGDQAAKSAAKASTSLDRFFGKADGAKALDKIFDRSRLATFELGASKIPIFGSAIEALGPAGVAAAVGLGAVTVAAEQARKAMEWADDLQKTADKLGVSTDSLQKFDYAAVSFSIGVEGGRAALSEFNGAIGKFETHTGDARLKRWADAIKLSRDQVNATVDPVDKLALVMERIATLSDVQSRTAAAKAFGLDGLIPIINGGTQSIQAFIGKMREAQGVGGVISSVDIAKAAELNDKVEALTFLIGQHFKEAFIELAPAIEKVAELIERVVRGVTNFLGEIPQAIRGMQDLIDKIPHLPAGVKVDVQGPLESLARAGGLGPGIDAAKLAKAGLDALASRGRAAQLHDLINDLMAGKLHEPTPPKPGQQLTFDPAKKAPKGPRDDTAERTDAVAQALATADKERLDALASLTTNIQGRADFEKASLDAEVVKQQAALQKQIDQINDDKGIDEGKKRQLVAQLALAQLQAEQTAGIKKQKIDTDTILQLTDIQVGVYQDQIEAQIAQLQAEADMASTAQQRLVIEKRILELRQKLEADLKGVSIDRREKQGLLTPEQAAKERSALGTTQAAARSQFDLANADPVQKYLRSVQDLDTEIETAGVNAMESLASGLADAIVNAKNLGDVAKNVFRQLVQDLLTAQLRSTEGNILSALRGGSGGNFLSQLFGGSGGGTDAAVNVSASSLAQSLAGSFASGTNYSPGGTVLVGERGPELLNIPMGSQIIPNDTLRSLARRPVAEPAAASVDRSFNPTWNIVTPNADSFRSTERQTLRRAKLAMGSV